MKIQDKAQFDAINVFGLGKTNTAFAKYFIGNSFLNPLTGSDCSLHVSNVTFEPSCRNNWHIHHAAKNGGQLLICTAGEGWYQEEGKNAVSLTPGKVIMIPANENIGTEPKKTAGLPILQSPSLEKIAAMSGLKPSAMKSTPNFPIK